MMDDDENSEWMDWREYAKGHDVGEALAPHLTDEHLHQILCHMVASWWQRGFMAGLRRHFDRPL
jgi:hypothetical protein